MKKIIALIFSALFASAAFAASPAVGQSVVQADSESQVDTRGSDNSVNEGKTADGSTLPADTEGEQDADD